jgi:hypothetical protein
MFGTSDWFLESNYQMFVGAWGKGIMVRVEEEQIIHFIESSDAESFDPMDGKPMRKYMLLNSERIA